MFLHEQSKFGLGLCAETLGCDETSVVSLLVILIHPPVSITLQSETVRSTGQTPSQCFHKSVFSSPNRPHLKHVFCFFPFFKRGKTVFQGLGEKSRENVVKPFRALHWVDFFMKQDLDADSVCMEALERSIIVDPIWIIFPSKSYCTIKKEMHMWKREDANV